MRRPASVLLVSLLAGCQLAPPHERPESPTAPHYPQAYNTDAGHVAPASIGWRDFLLDPRLHRSG